MTLAPMLNAPAVIQLHAAAAMGALGLGIWQLAAIKGTTRHRLVGAIWVTLMAVVALSSLWIHELRMWGPWSVIHLLSIFTLVMLPIGVLHAHRHQVGQHRKTMLGLFAGALVVAGLFTVMPGRIIGRMLFGG